MPEERIPMKRLLVAGGSMTRLITSLRDHLDVVVGAIYESWGDRRRRFDRAHRKVWKFDTPANYERYAHVLQAAGRFLAPERWRHVLEVGCGTGEFAGLLASIAQHIDAVDISAEAVRRAAQALAGKSNVHVREFDIVKESLSQQFDVVFALDFMEAIHGPRRIRLIAGRLAHMVRPGGLLVLSGSRLPEPMRQKRWTQRLLEGIDLQIEVFGALPGLRLVAAEPFTPSAGSAADYPEHLILVFRKSSPEATRGS